jgi:predicted negative regulator of RcsB-dependent stress response
MKSKLAILQKQLIDKNNQKDYLSIESVLKGNYLIKQGWRKDFQEYYSESIKDKSNQSYSLHSPDDSKEEVPTFLT